MKKIGFLILATCFLFACGGGDNSSPAADPEALVSEAAPVPEIVPGDLLENPEKFLGQVVTLTGTVQHVCERSGKRMFLSGPDDPEKTFKVTAGRDIGEFSIDLNGSDVSATGEIVVQKVDQAYLENWAAEIETGAKPEAAHEGHGAWKEEKLSESEESKIQLENMRKALEKSGKDQLLFYSLDCTEYEVVS